MRIIESLDALDLAAHPAPIWLTIGVFDGLHLGHRALMSLVTQGATAAGGTSVVFTFRDHPLRLLAPPHCPPRLVTPARRREILQSLGVDLLIEIPFTREFAAIPAERFIADLLVGRCRIAHIACGSGFRFGSEGAGDVALLKAEGARLGFQVHAVRELMTGTSQASSTAIRDLVMRGEVENAASLLLRPYELEGTVVLGDQRGRQIGYPTANLQPAEGLVVPADGVYACQARVGTGDAVTTHGAMVNIGVRPTFDGSRRSIEAHLFDFARDIYGAPLRLGFLSRLRGERKFAGIDDLKAQLARDEQAARQVTDCPVAD